MFCSQCGKQINDSAAFCKYCGTKTVPISPPEASQNISAEKQTASNTSQEKQIVSDIPADNEQKKKKSKKEKGKRTKHKKWPFVLLAVMLLLIALLFWAAKMLFPLEISFDAAEKKTTTGIFEHFQVEIEANQPIRSVAYALNPENHKDTALYIEADCTGQWMDKTLTIENLQIMPGTTELWIYVETLFGSEYQCVKLKSEIGYSAAPDPESYVEIDEGTKLISNELLVIFKDSADPKAIENLVSAYGGEIVGQLYFMNQYQLRFTGSGEDYINDIKVRLEQEELVDAVYYNMAIDISMEAYPNDSAYDSWNTEDPTGNNWGLECINACSAWEHQDSMSVVKVGVIDTFLYPNHNDLQIDSDRVSILATDDFSTHKSLEQYYEQNIDTHECYINSNGVCIFCEQMNHGTHCTGIIGAIANNGQGVSGVNWNTEMYFTTAWYYTIPMEGQLEVISTLDGLSYAIAHMVMNGCRVINLSIGSSDASSISPYETNFTERFDRMIQKLEEAGYDFLLIKAAGNSNDDASNYMLNRILTGGEYSNAHTVIVGAVENASSIKNRLAAWMGDTKKIYNMAWYSNYGSLIDVTAPGSDIYSTVYGNEYDNLDGTSMAAPMVAVTASLLYSVNPDLDYNSVKSIICFTGEQFCSKSMKTDVYSIVNAGNAIDWVLEHANTLPERELPTIGFITGIVQDAQTLNLISDAAVLITNEETGDKYESVVMDGTYYCYLTPGTYTMEFAAEGYIPETIYHVAVTADEINYNVMLNMVTDNDSPGIVSGRIVDAFDASSIAYADLEVYAGINQTSGTPVAVAQSDEYGMYTLSLAPGNYTLRASAEGYLADSAPIVVISELSQDNQDCTLTPLLQDGEMRVILTWGSYPYDLDSHLVGPAINGTFHTFYYDQEYYYDGVLYDNLDVDDTDSYGPETTSVYVGLDGTYTFYVHNYSDCDETVSSTMATSGAQVKLYLAGQSTPIVYNVPNQPGTLWTVFSVENGVITPINEMSYHYNPDTVGR